MLFWRSVLVAQSLSLLSILAPPQNHLKNQGEFMGLLIFNSYLNLSCKNSE